MQNVHVVNIQTVLFLLKVNAYLREETFCFYNNSKHYQTMERETINVKAANCQ